MASPREKSPTANVSLRDALVSAGLEPDLADLLEQIPCRIVHLETRRPFREPGSPGDEVMFVRSGIISKFKADGSGRRQIVALHFPGDAVLPREGAAQYGIQAIVRSELILGRARDFNALVNVHPHAQRFIYRILERNEDICYEWLVNCGRRDSMARVAHLLCEIAARLRNTGTRMTNPFTQQQIADITCQTSVNVNRVLADMERQGLIRRRGREIEFTDWAEIQRVGSFQPAYLAMNT